MPKECPWCQKPKVEVTGPEMCALRGMIRYDCGTVISLYDVMVQISNPCKSVPQWMVHEDFLACCQTTKEGK
jgi:hypothetical protein